MRSLCICACYVWFACTKTQCENDNMCENSLF